MAICQRESDEEMAASRLHRGHHPLDDNDSN